jgi:hypothetical protein
MEDQQRSAWFRDVGRSSLEWDDGESQPLSFEVASIKANRSGDGIQRFQPSAGGRFTALNCSPNILIEYAFQIKRFEISYAPDWVRSDKYDMVAKSEGDPEIRDMPGMVQRLLEDRFQFRHHWETKEGAGYDLVVSKPEKLRESEPGDCPPIASAKAPCGYLPNTPWTPEPVLLQSTPPEPSGASIFTALQEQLGLKLESAKGPVKTLVIDHIERPSDN